MGICRVLFASCNPRRLITCALGRHGIVLRQHVANLPLATVLAAARRRAGTGRRAPGRAPSCKGAARSPRRGRKAKSRRVSRMRAARFRLDRCAVHRCAAASVSRGVDICFAVLRIFAGASAAGVLPKPRAPFASLVSFRSVAARDFRAALCRCV
jgi:hypothetical protein